MSLTYRLTTLGCRVNHAESRDLESILRSRGLERAGAGLAADLEVVHTCTVTGTAAAKSRQAIRRAVRRGRNGISRNGDSSSVHASTASEPCSVAASGPTPTPSPEVIVTGCFTTTDPVDAARIAGGRDRIVEHQDQAETPATMVERFARRVDHWLTARPNRLTESIRSGEYGSSGHRVLPLPMVTPAAEAGTHVRAELKIQDGCDAHCSFCIIPKIRRTLRSKTVADAVAEARRLVDLGHREIVLTGVFIGAYGHETALRRRQTNRGAAPLADLVDAVARVPGLQRLRVSSMEPGDVSEPLLDAMRANEPVVVPHLHLPLQSGSDAVLARMNRQYRVGDYLEMIATVESALTTEDGLPPAITTDIICGFPGETEADFQQTVAVARRVGYLHMHVFPFSPRDGTAAARWREQFVAPEVARRRVRRLIDLEDAPGGLAERFRERLLGRTVRVILEQPARDDPSLMTGRCDHYVSISVKSDRPRGTLVRAEVTGQRGNGLFARPMTDSFSLPVLI